MKSDSTTGKESITFDMIYTRTHLRLPDRDFDLDLDLDFDLDLDECDRELCRLRLRRGDTDRCRELITTHRQTDMLVFQ